MIPVLSPSTSEKMIEEMTKVLKSGWWGYGPKTQEFEKKFAEYVGAKYAVGCNSGTSALDLCLKVYGIKGGELITTPMTFVSDAIVGEWNGMDVTFADIDEDSLCINPRKIVITDKTKAIIAVDSHGRLADIEKIREIATENIDGMGLTCPLIIEDAAHAIGAKYKNKNIGTMGDFASFSFYATKNITSGEGGAISCHNIKTYEWLKKARLHGMSKDAAERYSKKYKHWDMEFLGFKMNMNNIQAALLINQLKRIEKLRRVKERIAKLYKVGFSGNPKIKIPSVMPNAKHARLLFTIWVDPKKRDNLLHSLQDLGIGVAVNFRPVHLLKYYRQRYGYKTGDFPVAERIGASTISLPFYPKLRKKEVNYIIKTVNRLTSSG